MASGEYLHDKNSDRIWKLIKRLNDDQIDRFGSSFELLDPLNDEIIQVDEELLLRGVYSQNYLPHSAEQGRKMIVHRRVEQLQVGDIIRTTASGTRRSIVNIVRMSSDNHVIAATLQHCETGATMTYHVTNFVSGLERGFISLEKGDSMNFVLGG